MTRDDLANQLRGLLPPTAYEPSAPYITAVTNAEAQALLDASDAIESVGNAAWPEYAGNFISDWERLLDITPSSGQSLESRIQTVLAILRDRGGNSINYFMRLARLIGVNLLSIDTFCRPVAGHAYAGCFLYGGDWLVGWRANAPLDEYKNPALENLLDRRRPATTNVVVGYGREYVDQILTNVDQYVNAISYQSPVIEAQNG
ncbi:hypothetical protein R84981_001698 [Carnimonas sp. R-84981]|uniref:putative phage tail protein n=1 Tax=Carnimonas bestiolae TaxID=3402172 RepID=UPI003EDB8481